MQGNRMDEEVKANIVLKEYGFTRFTTFVRMPWKGITQEELQ